MKAHRQHDFPSGQQAAMSISAATYTDSPLALAQRFTEVEQELASLGSVRDAYAVLTRLAVERVPGAQQAGVTLGRGGRFVSHGTTADVVDQVDKVQYQLVSGPCVDAATQNSIYRSDDLRVDPRWPVFAAGAVRLGVLSMISFRLHLTDGSGSVAALNLYSAEAGAFDETSESIGILLATLAAVTVAGAAARDKAVNLQRALDSNREIGMAMGVLIGQYKLTREQAFDVLRITSQDTNRKLAELATEVIDTGKLELSRRLQRQD